MIIVNTTNTCTYQRPQIHKSVVLYTLHLYTYVLIETEMNNKQADLLCNKIIVSLHHIKKTRQLRFQHYNYQLLSMWVLLKYLYTLNYYETEEEII